MQWLSKYINKVKYGHSLHRLPIKLLLCILLMIVVFSNTHDLIKLVAFFVFIIIIIPLEQLPKNKSIKKTISSSNEV